MQEPTTVEESKTDEPTLTDRVKTLEAQVTDLQNAVASMRSQHLTEDQLRQLVKESSFVGSKEGE